MTRRDELNERAIKDVVADHPAIGEILKRADVACITCQVGICLFKDVLGIHALTAEQTARVDAEINSYLNSLT